LTDATAALGIPPVPTQGVAMVDYTGDNWPDITLATASGLYLFQNGGDGTFSADNQRANIPPGSVTRAMAPVYADVDGDGDLDLMITTNGDSERLFINDGTGVFQDKSMASGFAVNTLAFGGSFADADGDGDLDLFVAGGLPQLVEYPGVGAPGTPATTHDHNWRQNPTGERGSPNRYWQNNGDGSFSDATKQAGLAGEPTDETFGAAWFDVDSDGDIDALVARDHKDLQLYLNNGSGVFTLDTSGLIPFKDTGSLMGIDIGDFDGNGRIDIYGTRFDWDMLVAQGKTKNSPFSPNRYPLLLTGKPDPTRVITGWGCALLDLDNDVDVDIVSVSTFDFQTHVRTGQLRPGTMVVLKNTGLGYAIGGLEDVTANAVPKDSTVIHGWGLAVGDYDRDGDVDVMVGVDNEIITEDGFATVPYDRRKKSMLLRNDSGTAQENGGLVIALRQPQKPNTFAVGARVDVTANSTQAIRIVFAGSPYLSTHSYQLHFGLGSQSAADQVTVTWPDGQMDELGCLPKGHHVIDRNKITAAPCP